jgi:hypothetical protein
MHHDEAPPGSFFAAHGGFTASLRSEIRNINRANRRRRRKGVGRALTTKACCTSTHLIGTHYCHLNGEAALAELGAWPGV